MIPDTLERMRAIDEARRDERAATIRAVVAWLKDEGSIDYARFQLQRDPTIIDKYREVRRG